MMVCNDLSNFVRLFSFKDSYTALHIAVEHCKPLAVQTLLGFGAKVELKGGKVRNSQKMPDIFLKDLIANLFNDAQSRLRLKS